MSGRRYVSAIAIVVLMLLSSVLLFTSRNASAGNALWTSDADFNGGNFFNGTGFQTELHGTGAAAYLQNMKDSTNWLKKYPATDTGPRAGFGFANDSYESRFILFGGLDGLSYVRNDTWEYNVGANNWEMVCADNACPPPRRYQSSMAYSNGSKVAVLYGGYAEDMMTNLDDTWEYDVTTNIWTNHTGPTRPRALGAHRVVYDPVGDQIVLVGLKIAPEAMEVWTYKISTHTWTQKTFVGGPSVRSSYALAYNYEAGYRRVVLFGGSHILSTYSDTWEYNTQTNIWTNVSVTGPSARADAAMTYSGKTGIAGLLLWGGSSATTETWRYWHPGGAATWNQLLVSTSPSPPRKQLGMAYDAGYNQMILYGGWTVPSGARLNDTWALENGYRLEGRYSSLFFNTYDTNTSWKNIFFNQSGAALPANTQMRLQVNMSNVCDEGASPFWYGPNKSPSQYFTTSGAALTPPNLFTGFSCIKFLADLITLDPTVAPRLEDVSLYYTIGVSLPKVASVHPTGPQQSVREPIYINFTKAMDTASVSVSIQPNITQDLPWTWYGGDTKLIIYHNSANLLEGQRYDICVWGNDKSGNPLNYPGNKYCWLFVTFAEAPTITSHTPNQGDVGVALTADIVVTFSKAMDTTTCWPYVTIDPPVTFNHVWELGNTRLRLSHAAPFIQFTLYTVEVPVGDNLRPCKGANNQLLKVGGPANPWTFQSLAINPFIVNTKPTHLNPFIPTNQVIWVNFSRFMDTSAGGMSFYLHELYTLTNVSLNYQWVTNMTLKFTHTAAFTTCKPYEMRIWARDFTGKQLIDNPNIPNPWRFFTGAGSGCAPFMIFTKPAEGTPDVSPNDNITIVWQFWPDGMSGGGMNTAQFTFKVTNPFGGDDTSRFTTYWYGMGNAAVQLNHSGYPLLCGQYTVRTLTARDLQGRNFIPGMAENPFDFTVTAPVCPPVVLWTQPTHMSLNVPPTQDIKVKFSKPMNTTFFDTSGFNLRPDKSPYTYTWSEGDTNVTITHQTFVMCEWYNASAIGKDKDGTFVIPGPVPNPWTFRADCVRGPKVNQTYPANVQMGIPWTASIWVNFTEPVVTSSLSFTLNPSAGTPLTYTWSGDRKSVKIDHPSPYTDCTLYTARVVDVLNDTGAHLVAGPVPNPWTFRAYCTPPRIVSTIPVDQAKNVGLGDSITVIFDKSMQSTSFRIVVLPPSPPVVFNPPNWLNAQTAVITHNAPFAVCTQYIVRVNATDLGGTPLGPGPVPNPWSFTTTCVFPVRNLQVHRAGSDVQLTWSPAVNASFYLVYHSLNNRLAPWPWPSIANVTTTSYTHAGAISDLQNHFYIVRAFKSDGSPSSNSTMGVLWHVRVTPNVGASNTFWFSLPYNSIYKKASDIATELGPSKTKVVAKWDPAKQQSTLYYYLNGKWRGPDFAIAAGDGMWIGIESAFDWAINGTDKTISIMFTFRNPPKTNFYWLSLPLTNKYASASQLVLSIAGGLGPGSNTKIDELGKWNFATQTSFVYKYGASGWGGNDFVINSGDAVWVRVTSTFAWSPELITPEVL